MTNTNVQKTTETAARQRTTYQHEPRSLYVVASFYDWLNTVSTNLGEATVREDQVAPAMWHQATQLLVTESRLLDQHAFQRWLALFTDDCAYWIPSGFPAPDPRQNVTLEFHDRRRLMDRISRLDTGLAYSQFPASRTSRQWSGLELWASPCRENEWHARYNFTVAESRNGHNRLLAGWNGFVLRETGGKLQIVVKQINLIDCDRVQGNNSFFL